MLVDRSGRAWAMRSDEMIIAQAMGLRENGADEGPLAAAGEKLDGSDFARVVNGVAIIPIMGLLMRSMNYWFWSYEEIHRDLRLAQAAPGVRSILLDIDSGGGLVAGCGDLAAAIRASGPKPVEAFVGGMCASAAYWLASAASRITIGSGTIIGSIGTVIEYVDIEPMFEKMGARVVRIVAKDSPNKRLDPDSPEGKAELQDVVDASCTEFVAGVAAHRGTTAADVLARFGQGLMFDGGEALTRGMVDARATKDSLLADLAARGSFQSAATATASEENPMDWDSITTATLREHRADIAEEIASTATATATTAATTAAEEATRTACVAAATTERERILGLDEVAVEGHEDLVAAARADGKTTAAELAVKIIKAEKASGNKVLSDLRSADASAAVAPVAPGTEALGGDGDGDIEAKAKSAWDKDAKLRAEFGGKFDTYLAFSKAESTGRARILRRA